MPRNDVGQIEKNSHTQFQYVNLQSMIEFH